MVRCQFSGCQTARESSTKICSGIRVIVQRRCELNCARLITWLRTAKAFQLRGIKIIKKRNEGGLRIAIGLRIRFSEKQESNARRSVVPPCRFQPLFRHRRGHGSNHTRSQQLVPNFQRIALHIAVRSLTDSFYSVTLPFAGRKTNSSSMRTAKWMAVTVAKLLKTNPAPRFDLG